jgi:hypothetical protein
MTLRKVLFGVGNALPNDHRDVLLDMGLIVAHKLGGFVVTDAGRQTAETAAWRGPPG